MAKIEQKVKANPVPFGRFWPLFQLFKNGTKTKATCFESFSTTPNVILGLFEAFSKSGKTAKNEQKVKANPLPFWSILATFSTF